METVCKMTGKKANWPCSAAGCPLFGDCAVAYAKAAQAKEAISPNTPAATQKPTNEEWLKSLPKTELANMIHCFHMHYSPWCDHHCENEGDDGCDKCILAWLGSPCTETEGV